MISERTFHPVLAAAVLGRCDRAPALLQLAGVCQRDVGEVQRLEVRQSQQDPVPVALALFQRVAVQSKTVQILKASVDKSRVSLSSVHTGIVVRVFRKKNAKILQFKS